MPVRYNPRTQKWDADYEDDLGKRRRRGFETKKEAKAHLLEVEAALKAGLFRAESEKVTIADVAGPFLVDSEKRVQTLEIDRTTHHNYKMHVNRYILGKDDLHSNQYPERAGTYFAYSVGHWKLKDFRKPQALRLRQELLALGLSLSMVSAVMGTLRRILDKAVLYGWVATNVAAGLGPLRRRADEKFLDDGDGDDEDDGGVFIPEKNEVAALCRQDEAKFGPVLWFAAATGVRSSEHRALAWRHIDLNLGHVRIRRRVNRFNQLGQTKSGAGRRTIPLAPGLLAELRAWKLRSKFSGPNDLVFPNGKGNIEAHSNWRRRLFYPAWERAQKEDPTLASRSLWRWHDLRHFAISCWIEADAPVKQVQKWAGHSSAQMTLDRYGHLFKSADHSAILKQVEAGIWQPS